MLTKCCCCSERGREGILVSEATALHTHFCIIFVLFLDYSAGFARGGPRDQAGFHGGRGRPRGFGRFGRY